MKKQYLIIILFSAIGAIGTTILANDHGGKNLADPYETDLVAATQDTIPLQERFGNSIFDKNNNPFDLEDPSEITKEVEYDVETGQYIVTEKIGEEYYRMPTYMTFDEYMDYKAKEQEQDYFNQLSGLSNGGLSGDDLLDPIKKLDIEENLLDRLFGGTDVSIDPQGNIDLTFGFDRQKIENPLLTERQRRTGGFDFDMAIQMSVDGKIGEKLKLGTNYNTQATFDFENQMKLAYDSHEFSEDEIIKTIEAGNVSLPLRTNLIQGSTSLFGIKVGTQFGRLWLTAIASQQKSRREQLQIQGGSQIQEFEAFADEYDENRHFFLSFFNRKNYEPALSNLPQINSLFQVTRMEVWVTNDRNVTEGVREIVAFADIGEGEANRLTNDNIQLSPTARRDLCQENILPDNGANELYKKLVGTDGTRFLDRTVSTLQGPNFQMQQARDFEKVRARLLSSSEFSYHPTLGYVSVNVNLRPDQVLGVSYEYTYNGEVYSVGEFTNDNPNNPDTLSVLFTKMLKSTTQRVDLPAWDLMMKNIYGIGAFQVNREDFKLDVFYEDPGEGEKRFLPETNLQGTPLIRVFNLDNLNSQGDPLPDGVFDFVDGLSIDTRGGRIIFPVLEPFGTSLSRQIDDPRLAEKYTYQMLYDSTVTRAREFPEFNRFKIKGTYKSSVSSEIQLGAFNLPEGSVKVTAGAQELQEGIDYEVDYNVGRLKILNDAILNSGVPVNVSFEDNTLFGFQTKTMLGLRADYRFSEDVAVGGTYMHLFERPFTQKVNIGDDPINNKILGLDVSINKNAPWLTKAVDRLPLLETKAESSVSFVAEGAVLKPGHSNAINQGDEKEGSVYLDDFEGSASSFDLRTPSNAWFLASVPQNDESNNNTMFPESELIDNTMSGVNRALLNWYRIDPSVSSGENLESSYSARILQAEVFPNLQITPGQSNNIQSLDLTYYPGERGPYNFDLPNGGTPFSDGLGADGSLENPESRWGGIMRALNSNNFEAANIEYLEFWVLSPFIAEANEGQRPDDGKLFIEIGNISEDILRDSRKSFENGLPTPGEIGNRPFDQTNWGRIPRVPPITNAFDNDPDKRLAQDVGLDGINDEEERSVFKDVLDQYQTGITNQVALQEIMADPANDNFLYFNDPEAQALAQNNPLGRYKKFNNSEGNSRPNAGGAQLTSGTNIPDSEDLNRDNTLSETESYFQYEIDIASSGNDIAETQYLTESRTTPVGRTWHRFKIPLDQFTSKVGGIQDFRSIRFIRMYMKEFTRPLTLRFARLELVRNQWRRYRRSLEPLTVGSIPPDGGTETLFDVNAVNIEQNSSKEPFNYVLPPNIRREQSLGAFPNVLQNEQSLSLEVCGLQDGDARAIFKNLNLDMRVFEELRMFVHAESEDILNDGDMNMFIRLGSDYEENYYEYEIPLLMSDDGLLPASNADEAYREEVWREENELVFQMSLFKDLKVERNNAGGSSTIPFEGVDPERPQNMIRVKGNPNLGLVKGVMIGVRNRADDGIPHCAEVWVNELRVSGFDERGGGAALARLDMQFADFGSGSVSANYSSIGWGSLEQKVAQRQREEIVQFDAATSLELGKFLPEESGIKIPFYASYSTTIKTPEYDPYDLDIKLRENLDAASSAQERDSLRKQAEDFTSIKSINFTNVRKERTSEGPPMPWDISNFSATYAHTETEKRDPIIESNLINQYRGALNYNYSMKPLYITPFKKIIKGETLGKQLALIKEANFNIVPNTFTFNTALDRTHAETKYRFAGSDEFFNTFYDKRFTWDRNYSLSWDLTKALKFNFNATNIAVIDELSTFVTDDNNSRFGERRSQGELDDEIKRNLRDLGRTKAYSHNVSVSYTVPTKNIPLIDWIGLRAQYGADYSWNAAALNVDSLGNVIANGQNRQASADLNFEKLYNKSKYLKAINSKKKKGKTKKGRLQDSSKAERAKSQKEGDDGKKKKKEKKARVPSAAERALIRPLMLIRKGKLSYAENYRTVIPGYKPESRYLGSSRSFDAPGWQFISGWQPDQQYLDDAADSGWITDNVFLNQQVVQNYTQNINGNLTIEPFKGFKLDLEASRSYTENYTEFFKVTEKVGGDFEHLTPRDVGSMTTSFYALNTLFDNDIIGLFNKFEDNRIVISDRLGSGTHQGAQQSQYSDGYGRYQNEVLIPAFLSAYTDQDPSTYKLGFDNLFDYIPRPNWRLSYNGLNKLPWFEDIFSSVRINHAYRSSMTVNSFNTDLDFEESSPFRKNENTYNYYSKYEIPGLVITEGFTPLLGIDMTFENSMNIRVDWSKSRDLQMSFTDFQLSETKTEEYTLSLGYTKEDVFISFLKPKTGKKQSTKQSRLKSKKDRDADPDGKDSKDKDTRGSDLNFKFDFSYRDDITINHLLDQNIAEPTRGLRTIRISPSVDYDVNENLNVRLFFDYSKTNPKTSASFPITSTQGGLRVRFTLN